MNADKLTKSLFDRGATSKTKTITPLIAGLAVGAVVAVLFATETGKVARQKIRDTLAGYVISMKTTNQLPIPCKPNIISIQ